MVRTQARGRPTPQKNLILDESSEFDRYFESKDRTENWNYGEATYDAANYE